MARQLDGATCHTLLLVWLLKRHPLLPALVRAPAMQPMASSLLSVVEGTNSAACTMVSDPTRPSHIERAQRAKRTCRLTSRANRIPKVYLAMIRAWHGRCS